MKKIFASALAALASIAPAGAQTPPQELATLQFQLFPLWCNGGTHASGKVDGGVMFLENYFERPFTQPLYILGSTLWIDGVNVIGQPNPGAQGKSGNIPITVDPQRQYEKEVGWPFGNGSPVYQPVTYKFIAYRRIETSPENLIPYVTPGNVPVRYTPGVDGLALSTECAGGDGVTPLQVWAEVNMLAPEPGKDLKDLTLPPNFFEKRYPLTAGSNPDTGTTARNVFPGPPAQTTKFRARIYNLQGRPMARTDHMSVCLQAGNTPNCQSTPVQLKFGSADGYFLVNADRVWSNVVDFTVPAGQNVLVTWSSFLPGQTNYWSSNLSAGGGMWWSKTDAWNTIGMTNPNWYQNGTMAVDAVQMWNPNQP